MSQGALVRTARTRNSGGGSGSRDAGIWLRRNYGPLLAFALFSPVAGLASAAVLLGETVSTGEIAGSALVFAGLLINVFGPRLFARRANV